MRKTNNVKQSFLNQYGNLESFSNFPGKGRCSADENPMVLHSCNLENIMYPVTDHVRIQIVDDHRRGPVTKLHIGIDAEFPTDVIVRNRDVPFDDLFDAFVAKGAGDSCTAERAIVKAMSRDCRDVVIEDKHHSDYFQKNLGKAEYGFFESKYYENMVKEKPMVIVNPTRKFINKMVNLKVDVPIVITKGQAEWEERVAETVAVLNDSGAKNVVIPKHVSDLAGDSTIKYMGFQGEMARSELAPDECVYFELNPYASSMTSRPFKYVGEEKDVVRFCMNGDRLHEFQKESVYDRVLVKSLPWGVDLDALLVHLPVTPDSEGNYEQEIFKLKMYNEFRPVPDAYWTDIDVSRSVVKEIGGTLWAGVEANGKFYLVSRANNQPPYDCLTKIRNLVESDGIMGTKKGKLPLACCWTREPKMVANYYIHPGSPVLVATSSQIMNPPVLGGISAFERVRKPTGKSLVREVKGRYYRMFANLYGRQMLDEKGKPHGPGNFYKPRPHGFFHFRVVGHVTDVPGPMGTYLAPPGIMYSEFLPDHLLDIIRAPDKYYDVGFEQVRSISFVGANVEVASRYLSKI